MINRNVLAAYDGSKASEKALLHAIKLVDSNPGSKLTVAYVSSQTTFNVIGFGVVLPQNYEEKIKEYENALVQQVNDKIKKLAYKKVVVLNGAPASAILEYAKDNFCDLIVMGNRGLGTIREWMLGSVSHNVVQHAQVPVLIVK